MIHVIISTEWHETDGDGPNDSTIRVIKAYRKKEKAEGYVKEQKDRAKHPENCHTSFDVHEVELED